MTGRYCWEGELFFEEVLGEKGELPSSTSPSSSSNILVDLADLPRTEVKTFQLAEGYKVEKFTFTDFARRRADGGGIDAVFQPGESPTQEVFVNDTPDALSQLLARIGKQSPELQRHEGHKLEEPEAPAPALAEIVQAFSSQLTDHISYEDPFARSYSTNLLEDAVQSTPERDHEHVSVIPSLPAEPTSAFHYCRMLLLHSGMVAAWKSHDSVVSLLDKTDSRLMRHLLYLDTQSGRMMMKAAVLYVGRGQEKEHEILNNMRGSEDYEDFIASLSWEMDLNTHSGFKGGSERFVKSGINYFCTPTVEAVLHVATKLSASLAVSQEEDAMMKKKRHIGNDEVQIIWNDHYRPYDRERMLTNVCKAWIIITPLPNTLYRIEVVKESVSALPFAPSQRFGAFTPQ